MMHKEKNNQQSNLELPRSSFPYIKLGYRLARIQRARKLKNEQICDRVGISRSHYQKVKMGEALPDMSMQMKLCEVLEIDPTKLATWVSYYAHKGNNKDKLEENPLKGALSHSANFEKSLENVAKTFFEVTGKKLNADQERLLSTLKKDLSKLFFLPILPLDFMVLMDELEQNKRKTKYLHEIDSIIQGERLSGDWARSLPLASFTGFVSEALCCEGSASKNIRDCTNRLSVKGARTILLMAATKGGIYTLDQELPFLTEHCELIHNEALACCELEPYIPQNISYDDLYNSIMSQLGKYAIYTILQPSLRTLGEEKILETSDQEGIYAGLDTALFKSILKEMSATASAAIAGNWGYSENVQQVLLNQNMPSRDVDPLSAAFQMITKLVSKDFVSMTKQDTKDFMEDYPQLSISTDHLMKIFVPLRNKIDELLEGSASTISRISTGASQYAAQQAQMRGRKIIDLSLDSPLPKMQDFRLDQDYLKAASLDSLRMLHELKDSLIIADKKETLEALQHRVGDFNLRVDYIIHRNLDLLSERWKIPKEEAKQRIRIK